MSHRSLLAQCSGLRRKTLDHQSFQHSCTSFLLRLVTKIILHFVARSTQSTTATRGGRLSDGKSDAVKCKESDGFNATPMNLLITMSYILHLLGASVQALNFFWAMLLAKIPSLYSCGRDTDQCLTDPFVSYLESNCTLVMRQQMSHVIQKIGFKTPGRLSPASSDQCTPPCQRPPITRTKQGDLQIPHCSLCRSGGN